MRVATKIKVTKQAMIQVIMAEELRLWNSLMFDIWYYGEGTPEVIASRRAWIVMTSTMLNLGIPTDHGPEHQAPITIPRIV